MKNATLVSAVLGSTLAAVAMTQAKAADNPFAATPLKAGYQLAQADKKADGKCGEAKCGADKRKESACGADKKKDASCGADKNAAAKTMPTPAADKKADGKCGEAKCGAARK
jgi:uncharacterized low-complexity protein